MQYSRVLGIVQFDWVIKILETDKHEEVIGETGEFEGATSQSEVNPFADQPTQLPNPITLGFETSSWSLFRTAMIFSWVGIAII